MIRAHLRQLITLGLPAVILILAAVAIAHASAGENFFMPHAHCYLFNGKLMLLHGGSDLFIGLSYVSISATLTYLVVRSRRELPFHWMMLAFALFIVACGATHFMEIWTLQTPHPPYWLAGWVKLLTALASVVTALLLPPLVPKIRGVMLSARVAVERKLELEKAYAELNELYRQAIAAAAPVMATGQTEPLAPTESDPERRHDLARMAKEVTEHARELERAKQAAESANLAKDQFLAVLSHELRTPLTPALVAASNLESAPSLEPAELKASLSLIRRNIELEARLVDDLLDLTRINKGKLEVHLAPVDLHETIQHAVSMCQAAAVRKQTEIELELGAEMYQVQGDVARLAQVFWNLILNAVKFSPAGAKVQVRTSNPEPGHIRVEVQDRGIGIEPAMLDRVFEPFQQAEQSIARRFGGIGLGLTIARGLVQAHRGQISAKSDGKDMGATFTVELSTVRLAPPVGSVHRPDASQQPATGAVPAQSSPALRILLVEDHEDTRLALVRLLTRWGHVVEPVASVEQAFAASGAFQPDLLLSDLGLPDGTGCDLLDRLGADRRFPAIAMSGYGMDADVEKSRQAGFKAHLVKPVSATQLKETIDRFAAV